MDLRESVTKYINDMKEFGIDIVSIYIGKGLIEKESDLIDAMVSAINNDPELKKFHKLHSEAIDIYKNLDNGVETDDRIEKMLPALKDMAEKMTNKLSGVKKEVDGINRLLPRLYCKSKELIEPNEYLKVNSIDDMRIVKGSRVNGQLVYFLQYSDVRKGHRYNETNIHPDPWDAAYAAMAGEKPLIKE